MDLSKDNGDIQFSEFDSVRSKKARTVRLDEYVTNVRSDAFKASVQEYRRLSALPGHEAQAQAVKNAMPCIVPAGVCSGGHAVKNLVSHSGLLQIDLDHTDGRTDEVCRLLRQLPYVTVAHKSFSQCGVRALVRVSVDDVRRCYERLYTAVGEAVSRHTAHPYDSKCKILTQPSFYAWDADAYYNPQAVPFRMQWGGDDGAQDGAPVPAGTPPPTDAAAAAQAIPLPGETAAAGTAAVPAASATATAAVATAGTAAAAAPPSAPGFLVQFLDDFERRNPFRRGERNDLALKLGRVARCKGFSTSELQELIRLFARHYSATDFTADDIRLRVMAGYQYVGSHPRNTAADGEGSSGAQPLMSPPDTPDEEAEHDELLEKNNELRAGAPYIPDAVYKALPEFLKSCVQYAADPRERDIMLLGSLNCCSAAFPGVRFFYKNATYSPHFYNAVVANAAAGKGSMAFVTCLLNGIQAHYDAQYRAQRRSYEQDLARWETEVQHARQQKRAADPSLKPEEPKGKYLKTSATTSKSRLVLQLHTNGELGCHMASTEIHTLISSLGQDYGKFEDILCKAAHHEEISQSYKIDGDPVVVPHPRLAVAITGTPEQFTGFFRSHETGLYSRFLVYTRQSSTRWETCAPGEGRVDLRDHFHALGQRLLEMHQLLLGSPTLVTFSPAQWERHTRLFDQLLRSTQVEGKEHANAIVLRHGLLAMRLAAVLTVFRKWDDYPYAAEYRCTDTDFTTAMHITTAVLAHSLLLGSTLPATGRPPVAMRRFNRFEEVLAQLSKKFSYTDFINAALQIGISKATAKRYLNRSVDLELIAKEENTYRKRNKKHIKQGS